MDIKTYNEIFIQLTKLSVNTEDGASVLLCYILAQLSIKYSSNSASLDGIKSNEFYQAAKDYGISFPLPDYIHDESIQKHRNLAQNKVAVFRDIKVSLLTKEDTLQTVSNRDLAACTN